MGDVIARFDSKPPQQSDPITKGGRHLRPVDFAGVPKSGERCRGGTQLGLISVRKQ
jgi:hypothetical protein